MQTNTMVPHCIKQGLARARILLLSLLYPSNWLWSNTWLSGRFLVVCECCLLTTASSFRRVSWQRVGTSVAAAVVSVGATSTWYSAIWLMGSSITGIASGMAPQSGGVGLWVSVGQSCSFGASGRELKHSECLKTFPSEWRLPRPSLDLCIRELFAQFVFSATPFLLQAICNWQLLFWCLTNMHTGACSLPVWWLCPLCASNEIVPALSAVSMTFSSSEGCVLRLSYPQVQGVLECASSWKLQSWAWAWYIHLYQPPAARQCPDLWAQQHPEQTWEHPSPY